MIYFTAVRSQPYSVAVIDFNNDTQLDIALSSYNANSVDVFLGYGNIDILIRDVRSSDMTGKLRFSDFFFHTE